MEKSYIIPIEIEKTGEYKKNIFSNITELKLHKEQINSKIVSEIIEKNLKEIEDIQNNIKVNFVGEYFTKLDIEKQEELLSCVYNYIKENKINSIIISSLPEDISKTELKLLKKYKVKDIKLEVATLNNYLLNRSEFSFDYETIKKATKLIRRYGFYLIYKIYIGLPESTKLDEINTAKLICKLKPKEVEIYPIEIKEKTKIQQEIESGEYEKLTIIQSVERAKEVFYILTKKKILVEIMDNSENKEFKKKVESGIWFDTIVDKIKQYNVKVKEVEIEVNPQNFDNAIGYENENIEKLKENYNIDSKVITKEEIKQGKIEILIKKKFTDFLEV